MTRPNPSFHPGKTGLQALLVVIFAAAVLVVAILLRDRPRPKADEAAVVRRSAVGAADGAMRRGADLAAAGASSEDRGRQAFAAAPDSVLAREAAASVRADAPQLVCTVIDAAGEPIAAATLLASTRWSRTSLGLDVDPDALRDVCHAESDTLGLVRIPFGEDVPLLRPGRRGTVLVRAPAHAPTLLTTDRIPELPPLDLGDVALSPGAVVTGRVLGPDGQPFEGARVFIGQTETRGALRVRTPSRGFEVAPTDLEGQFRCDELREGPFHVLVDAPGSPLGYVEGEARLGRPVVGLLVRLERGAPIAGRVTGAFDPTVLEVEAWLDDDEGASAVARRPRSVTPDAAGEFTIDGLLPAREYELTVSGPSTGRRRPRTQPVRAIAGERDVELEWNARASVTGRLVTLDLETGEPVPVESYLVWSVKGAPERDDFDGSVLSTDGEPAREHGGGRFVLSDVDVAKGTSATLSFRFRAVGFEDLIVRGVDVPAGEAVDLGDLELVRGDVVRVRVLAAETGEPVEGARAFLVSKSNDRSLDRWRLRDRPAWASSAVRYGETDDQGRATLQLPPGGAPWRLGVNADSFPKGDPIEVVDASEEIVFTLVGGASVEAMVVDSEGAPVPGVTVDLYPRPARGRGRGWEAAQPRTLKTDTEGRALFENVEPGPSTLSASPPSMRPRRPSGWAESRIELEVPSEGGVTETLIVPATARVVGRVMGAGAPLPDARIGFAVREGNSLLTPQVTSDELRAITGVDGEFTLEAVPVGVYEVGVVHRTRAMPTIVSVVVEAGMDDLVIRLENAAVEGRVVSAKTGEPVAGVSVEILGPNEIYNAYIGERTRYERRDGSLDERDDWDRLGHARTGPTGEFAFRGLSLDVGLRLRVRGAHVQERSVKVGRLGVGEIRRDVEVRVQGASVLRVELDRIGQSRGRSRTRVGVRVWRLGRNDEPRGRPDQRFGNRSIQMTGLAPGRVRVETVRYSGQGNEVLESRDVELVELEELRLRMRGE